METQEFTTAIAELSDVAGGFDHPLLTKIKFILATNEPYNLSTARAGMKQGIREEDFDDVIRTAINTPIKMRFLRNGVGNHVGSIPVGHISKVEKIDLENNIKALSAEGVLYTSEYPDEIGFLKTAFAAKEAPGISYEIRHDATKSIIENGIEWIKDLITQAATIVRSPAYGSRTAILALASDKDISNEEFEEEVRSIITPKKSIDKGGSSMDEKDKEIQRLTALASEAEEAKKTALAAKETELTTLKETLEKAQTDLEAAQKENSELKTTILVESRVKAYAEAGLKFDEDTEKAKAKKDLLAKMDEDVFKAYLDDLKEAHASKRTTALASASDRGVPRLSGKEMDKSLDDLKADLRGISRK